MAALKAKYEKESKKVNKAEQKLQLLTQGYEMRKSKLLDSITSKLRELQEINSDTGSLFT